MNQYQAAIYGIKQDGSKYYAVMDVFGEPPPLSTPFVVEDNLEALIYEGGSDGWAEVWGSPWRRVLVVDE